MKGIRKEELLPFHPLGEAKYHSLDMEYRAAEFGKLAPVFKAVGL